ncbi:Chitinase 2 [Umbelopsis sp. WA50703]
MVSSGYLTTAITAAALFASSAVVSAFDATCNGNYALYWGQDSSNNQQSLASYCQDSTVDIIILAFLYTFYGTGNEPEIDFANEDGGCSYFSGTSLYHCPSIGADIKTCQSKGKKIILSLGGAVGSYGFTSDSAAQSYADEIWGLFGNGNGSLRPFDTAVVDGFDLDIEGGANTGYAAFITQMRTHYAADTSKTYYISGAPQCPFPDQWLGASLDSAWYDFVWVQFYNNYCSVEGGSFNFDTWDNWAKNSAVNPNVKVFLGLPGSTNAAGSGYVSASTLETTIPSLRSQYSSFGGVMMWDASEAYDNTEVSPNFATVVGGYVHSGDNCGTSTSTTTKASTSATKATTTTKTTTKTTTTSSATATSTGSCPVSGAACTQAYACSGTQYAQCVNGKWLFQPCPSGLICQLSGNGASAYCDYASGHTEICASANSVKALSVQSVAVPATKSQNAQVAFVVSDASADATTFSGIFNVRSTSTKAIGNAWTLTFTIASGETVGSSSVGTVSQSGNTVTIKANRKKVAAQSEAVLVDIKGSKAGDKVFVGIDPSTINFSF